MAKIEWHENAKKLFRDYVELQKEDALFRRCHLMNHRFKLIYFYDEVEDTVHIMDIWDTKANPKALIKRIT